MTEEECPKCEEEEPIDPNGKVAYKTEKTAQEEIRKSTEDRARNFAEAILKVLNEFTTKQELDYDQFLKNKKSHRVSMNVEYPLYEQQQACYAINKLIERTGKISFITSYCEGERCSADYEEVEVKRGTWETLLTNGKIFFTWKEMKCIASLFFRGNYAEASFLHSKKDTKIMKEFQAELREFMRINNYFKGEKIELLPYSRIKFLEYPSLSWKDLILEQELKEEIELNLLFPLKNPELCQKHSIPWRRGLLLAGVPGTGKTQLGRVLCNALEGITVIWATTKAIHDVSRLKTLFDIARQFIPSLIIMEDIDFFGHDREFITNPIVGELLNQLDGNAPNEGVFVLATTNRPQLLDRALADRPSRFDVKLLFEPPGIEERRKMVELFIKGKEMELPDDYIAGVTEGLTGSHIKEIINYAMLLALKRNETKIRKEHIDKAIRKMKEKLEKTGMEMVT